MNTKAIVDDQIQRSNGRVDTVETSDVEYQETGGRYIDFLVPGFARDEFDGRWSLGRGVCDR